MELLIGGAVGLVIGWNFLPQPKIVADYIAALVAKIKAPKA